MLLDVSKALVAPGNDIPFEGSVTLSGTSVLDEAIIFPEPVRVSGTYVSAGDTIAVRGTISFVALACCARCLEMATHAYEAPFDALFSLADDPDDPDLYRYEGAFIDPEQLIAHTALMSLPLRWLCEEDCKGLCPVCGTNRNMTPCTCRQETGRAFLSALKQLSTEPPAQDESEV